MTLAIQADQVTTLSASPEVPAGPTSAALPASLLNELLPLLERLQGAELSLKEELRLQRGLAAAANRAKEEAVKSAFEASRAAYGAAEAEQATGIAANLASRGAREAAQFVECAWTWLDDLGQMAAE